MASANCRILDIVNFMTDLGIPSQDDPKYSASVTKLAAVKFQQALGSFCELLRLQWSWSWNFRDPMELIGPSGTSEELQDT